MKIHTVTNKSSVVVLHFPLLPKAFSPRAESKRISTTTNLTGQILSITQVYKMFRPFGSKEPNNWFLCFWGHRIRKSHQFFPITYSFYDTEVTHFWPKTVLSKL